MNKKFSEEYLKCGILKNIDRFLSGFKILKFLNFLFVINMFNLGIFLFFQFFLVFFLIFDEDGGKESKIVNLLEEGIYKLIV